MRGLLASCLIFAALLVAACGDDEKPASGPAQTATAAATSPCAKENLALFQDGKLTVGTDKPAYPPYFEDDDPANGKGFESAVAYAVAEQLGFAPTEVEWTVVPFNSSYAPGRKKFDFDINQISITPQRQKRVDFSEPYFEAPQAVIAPAGSPVTGATSLAALQDAKIGVQVGTTSLDAVNQSIKPKQQPQVFNDSNDTVRALKGKRVDAIVVDLPTAFYLVGAEVQDAKIVGQFAAPGGDRWGLLLAKDSSLTDCVNEAIGKLKSSGELDKLQDQWMGGEAAPPLS
jgi:polar amino acid transport system substrate-binding protein